MSDPRYMNVWRKRYGEHPQNECGPSTGMHGAAGKNVSEVYDLNGYLGDRIRAIPFARLQSQIDEAMECGNFYRAQLLAAEQGRRRRRWQLNGGAA